jgi:CARDB
MKTFSWFTQNRLMSHLRIGTAVAFLSAAMAVVFLAAGCGKHQPDLVVEASPPTGGFPCDNGKLSFTVHATIKNQGQAAATLPAEWTKPWVTAYPSTSIQGFVQPYQTGGKIVTLKTGESTSVDFPVILERSEGGAAYDLTIQVDPYDVIQESNENNNKTKIAIPANVCG